MLHISLDQIRHVLDVKICQAYNDLGSLEEGELKSKLEEIRSCISIILQLSGLEEEKQSKEEQLDDDSEWLIRYTVQEFPELLLEQIDCRFKALKNKEWKKIEEFLNGQGSIDDLDWFSKNGKNHPKHKKIIKIIKDKLSTDKRNLTRSFLPDGPTRRNIIDKNKGEIKSIETFLSNQGIALEYIRTINKGFALKRHLFSTKSKTCLAQVRERADDIQRITKSDRLPQIISYQGHVGIDIPNESTTKVSFFSIINDFFVKEKLGTLVVPIGNDVIEGKLITMDLAKAPHLLIAGATGQGKSSCLNSIITGLIISKSPADVQFILIDPKRVELSLFSKIPHLYRKIINGENLVEETRFILGDLVSMMDKRFLHFAFEGKQDIKSYNVGKKLKMPYIVVIIDEYSGLINEEKRQVKEQNIENNILKLASMARAAGIHIILATQSPSDEAITPLIKANFTSRIALTVRTEKESMVIIDQGGAELLMGHGDMLFVSVERLEPRRIKGILITSEETAKVCHYINEDKYGKV